MQKEGRKKKIDKAVLHKLYRKIALYVLIIAGVQIAVQLILGRLFAHLCTAAFAATLTSLVNSLIAVFMIGFIAYTAYRRLHEIGESIDALASGETVQLAEHGLTENLAASINKTAERLNEQQRLIEQRDYARMEWIRGVSHDIRTPLSMVMGYSEALEEDVHLGAEARRYASVIKEQSLRMRELIEDLNLTSKLEYNRQPLRLECFRLSELLREAVAEKMNSYDMQECSGEKTEIETDKKSDRNETLDISILILPEFEKESIYADRKLLRRVFDNLIGNAIRHNPKGCAVVVLAYVMQDALVVKIADNGRGIPKEISAFVNSYASVFADEANAQPQSARTPEQDENEAERKDEIRGVPHIMGMRIAKQIMLAHGGNLLILPDQHTAEVILPRNGCREARESAEQLIDIEL